MLENFAGHHDGRGRAQGLRTGDQRHPLHTAAGVPAVNTVQIPLRTLNPAFLDFNKAHQRAFTQALFPTLRILDAEWLELDFTELDDFLTGDDDHLIAELRPIPLDGPQHAVTVACHPFIPPARVPTLWPDVERPPIPFPYQFFGRYEVYGWLGHHSRNPRAGCLER